MVVWYHHFRTPPFFKGNNNLAPQSPKDLASNHHPQKTGIPEHHQRTLFTKAAPDGVSLGDCPFSHAVQIALNFGLEVWREKWRPFCH